jgi:hypothetical protein
MRRLLLLLLLLSSIAVASDHKAPSVLDPLPFDHEVHDPELSRLGLGCVDCHAFGDAVEGAQAPAPVPVNLALCHACHKGEVAGVSPKAPRTCAACHPVREELRPEDHHEGWVEHHGPSARSLRSDCADCHARSSCVSCHEQRGALARSPHPTAFRFSHGIEAKLDPASCDTCHAAQSCTACHETGGVPW